MLDGDSEAFLRELSGMALPPASGAPIEALRQRFRVICERFRGPLPEMRRVESCAASIPLRRYEPFHAREGCALLWLHGGRMIMGDLETHDAACRLLAHVSNWPVIAADYRLGPEHPYPAALEDAAAALEWTSRGFATTVVGGDSAGGALALDAVLHAPETAAGLVLVYPMIDATQSCASHQEFWQGPGTSGEDIAFGYQLWLPAGVPRDNARVSPRFAALPAGLPPVWLVTAEVDPLRDEGRELAVRMRAAGVRITVSEESGHIHGFLTYPGRFRAAHRAASGIAGFLRAL